MDAVIPIPAMPVGHAAGGGVFPVRRIDCVGNGFDPSAPMRPLHPVSASGEWRRGAIARHVNGQRRQVGDLRQLIRNVGEISEHLRSAWALAPGDLIVTGTPAGEATVVPGDVMHGAVDGLGSLHVVVR